MPTVACVLKSGGEFKPEHVAHLYLGVLEHWPWDSVRFVILTDTPNEIEAGFDCCELHQPELRPLTRGWQRWWSKMELYAPEHQDLGRILYIDLDTVIVGDLMEISARRELLLLRDFYRLERFNSGLMMLPPDDRAWLWDRWEKGMSFRRGDGDFVNAMWINRAQGWQDVLPGQVVSYKVHVARRGPQGRHIGDGTVPDGARIVCFHGRPRPWTVPDLWK